MAPFALELERTCELIDEAIECFAAPRARPRRPPGALEPHEFFEHLRAKRVDVDGMHQTAAWLHQCAEVQQQNRAALGALLWAARQYRDALPPEMHGARGHALTRALIHGWGLRRDVPRDLPGCRQLAELYGSRDWHDVNRRQEAAE